MPRSKTFDIISTFSTEELKEFTAFVRSPYFNTNKNLVKLYDVIKKHLLRGDLNGISEEEVFGKTFPGKKFNYGIMKNLVSELASLAEEFLVVNSVRSKPLNRYRNRILLADEYDNRRLDRYYGKIINKVTADIEKEPIDNYYYFDRVLAEESRYFFNSSRSNDKGLEDAIYNEMIYSVCEFYRRFSRNMWKIHINIDNVNSKYEKDLNAILAKHIDFKGLADEMKGLNQKDFDYIKLNELLIRLLINDKDPAPFWELKKLIYDTIESYENYERFSILTKALSYCSTAHRSRFPGFMRESLDMRILMMEKVKFNSEGLGPFNFHYFTETIMMFIHEKDIAGANEFLEKYGDSVGPVNQGVNYKLSKAYILTAENKYTEAISLLAGLWHKDTEINLRIRRLYFILYYNLNEFEAGLDAVNAFRAYIKTNKDLTDILRQKYLTTVYFLEKVFKIKAMPEKYTAEDIESITEDHKKRGWIMQQWISEKLVELRAGAGSN
jgi:hypothetical protein